MTEDPRIREVLADKDDDKIAWWTLDRIRAILATNEELQTRMARTARKETAE